MLNQFGELFSTGLLALISRLLGGPSRLEAGLSRSLGGQTGVDKVAACLAGHFFESVPPNPLGLVPLGPGLSLRRSQPGGSRLLGTCLPDLNGQRDRKADEDEDDNFTTLCYINTSFSLKVNQKKGAEGCPFT